MRVKQCHLLLGASFRRLFGIWFQLKSRSSISSNCTTRTLKSVENGLMSCVVKVVRLSRQLFQRTTEEDQVRSKQQLPLIQRCSCEGRKRTRGVNLIILQTIERRVSSQRLEFSLYYMEDVQTAQKLYILSQMFESVQQIQR